VIPLAQAYGFAEMLRDELAGVCERIEIAGSVRRRVANVKDVELVAVPKRITAQRVAHQPSLFGGAESFVEDFTCDVLDETIQRWLERGDAKLRLDKNERKALGPSYKRLLIDGVAVDLFVVQPPAQWGLIYMIRTGSADFAKGMLARWKTVTAGGRSAGGVLHLAGGTQIETPEEEDCFTACRVVWVPPTERHDKHAIRASM